MENKKQKMTWEVIDTEKINTLSKSIEHIKRLELNTFREVWNKWQEEIDDYNFAEWLYNKAYPNETTN